MTRENEEKLVKLIASICRLEVDEEYVRRSLQEEQCNIIEKLGFDSLLMVELVVEIEDVFGMEFDMNSLDMNKLKFYDQLKHCIEACIGDNKK